MNTSGSLQASPSPIWLLVRKDWYFNRWPIALYTTIGLLALLAIAGGGETGFYFGSIALITVLISIGIHLTMITVVHERKDQTLAFVMTLPISARQYTVSKILANVLVFGAAWTVLVVGSVAVIAGRAAIPDGLIPFAIVVLGEIFASYCVLLAVALISESMTWTIVAMVVGNLGVQAVMYAVSHAAGVGKDLAGNAIVWRRPIVGTLAGEILVIVLSLALTLYLQRRKTDFL